MVNYSLLSLPHNQLNNTTMKVFSNNNINGLGKAIGVKDKMFYNEDSGEYSPGYLVVENRCVLNQDSLIAQISYDSRFGNPKDVYEDSFGRKCYIFSSKEQAESFSFEKEVTIKFNSSGSSRVCNRIKMILPNAWSVSASLGSKRRSFTARILKQDIELIKSQILSLGCTSIKTA